jgi:hypothetical protein
MRYLVLIYGEEMDRPDMTPEEQAAEFKRWDDYTAWLHEKGWHLGGEALQPTSTATTVREENGKTITTDGPFTETKEQLGGYYLIRCDNLDQAIEAASRIPSVSRWPVEVRPIMEYEQPS